MLRVESSSGLLVAGLVDLDGLLERSAESGDLDGMMWYELLVKGLK